MDLPKGLVKDDRRIYEDVAALTQPLPADFIIRMWRLYTTTNLKLVDPTARRLENLWWHVMGSDRCKLKAATVAKIWEHISYGPTFVPLRGSPNRWEGPSRSADEPGHKDDFRAVGSQGALGLIISTAAAAPDPEKNQGRFKIRTPSNGSHSSQRLGNAHLINSIADEIEQEKGFDPDQTLCGLNREQEKTSPSKEDEFTVLNKF
ncbi:uncharacterized protein ColSpa_02630 [Colletotrichum spaethianum]|uniref:Nitrogen regulatory protein areA GATA-like domain-containing protein n=1 Tax=Colletotrichum spaethianum TaxID=700344 RepID=A0AA37L9E9_9PEZI|nr:uncharacterized protein ColSpa_02630 [Colletotrichum spaethianum]GKT42449.1 hypothetical protein ColSpa_02630 [Colletotrichum spaethianum]